MYTTWYCALGDQWHPQGTFTSVQDAEIREDSLRRAGLVGATVILPVGQRPDYMPQAEWRAKYGRTA